MPRIEQALRSSHGILKNTLHSRSISFIVLTIAAIIQFCALPAQGQINVLSGKKEIVLRTKIKDSDCQPLIAENNTNAPITIVRIESGAWSESFELNDTSSIARKLAPGESVNLGYICFRPVIADKESHATLRIITLPKQSSPIEISVQGTSFGEAKVNTIPATAAGAILAFDPSTSKEGTLISMIGHDMNFMRAYTFKNTSSLPYTVTDIHFQNKDQQFEVTAIEPDGALPLEVAPGESFSVRFSYRTMDRIPHTNTLLISTDQTKEPAKYEVRGLAMPLSEMQWNKQNAQK